MVPLRVSRGSQRAIGSQMGCTPLGELWFVAYSLYASAQLEFSLFLRLAGIVMSGCGMHAIVPFMTGVIRVVHV